MSLDNFILDLQPEGYDVLLMIVRLIICLAGYGKIKKANISMATGLLVKATLQSIAMYNTTPEQQRAGKK